MRNYAGRPTQNFITTNQVPEALDCYGIHEALVDRLLENLVGLHQRAKRVTRN